jgi:pimeloyl-ACP methyl ester carboxylesterase
MKERQRLLRSLGLAVALVAALALSASAASGSGTRAQAKIRFWKIEYRAHNGVRTAAWVLLPAWYGPRNHPPIPLVISPHGRGVSGRTNAHNWGALPAAGPFAVVNPDGQGRVLSRYSWGSAGQIEDLAKMPDVVARTLPWLHIDRARIYAFGGSMGGQETLLLAARHPRLLAGAAVFDSVVDLSLQYRRMPELACNQRCRLAQGEPIGKSLQGLVRREVGGPPARASRAYTLRSPMTYAHALAASCLPLQMWWSVADRIVIDQQQQSGRLFWKLRELNPDAPVQAFVGNWIHSSEMKSNSRLPLALATFDLLPSSYRLFGEGLHLVPPPASSVACG